MTELESRCLIVTGAGGGIGRSAAQILARKGASVVVADIAEEAGEETVDLIRASGGMASFFRCDVTREPDARDTVAFALETYGRRDGASTTPGSRRAGCPCTSCRRTTFSAPSGSSTS